MENFRRVLASADATTIELINPNASYTLGASGVGNTRGLFFFTDRDLQISSAGFSAEMAPGLALTTSLSRRRAEFARTTPS